MPKKKPIEFEINLTKMKWCPKHLHEVPASISRAFETEISMETLQPIIGTDHVKEWILKEDKDIPEFYNAPTMMQEWIAEKVIKVKIPPGLMPEDFVPKKTKILARGNKVAKFFGEDSVSTRTVEAHLKLFDCGHFYLKQTLPGGASPHWTIFEGRWCSTERGLKLEYLLRYSWQLSRKPYMEFNVEATKSDLATTLAWDGETEKQLNGNLPAIVGTDDLFWANLVREGDVKAVSLRWNEDCPEPPSWTRKPDAKPQPQAADAPAKEEASEASHAPQRPELHERWRQAPEPAKQQQQQPAAPAAAKQPAAAPASSASAAPAAPAPRPPPKAPTATGAAVCSDKDEESPWPLYIGFGLFVLMAAGFVCANMDAQGAM